MENNPTENQTDTNIQLNVKENEDENDITVPSETVNKDKGIINETKVFEWENSRNNMDKTFENIICDQPMWGTGKCCPFSSLVTSPLINPNPLCSPNS